ncbi:hypothetical protein RB653_008307 [Dictyostelium firmibasis]|uniref:Uncharacterized protein n=1 Tax=Dictyostelium firmibasis TaxID=79012 RepID=A0AAN7U049_9MYCE
MLNDLFLILFRIKDIKNKIFKEIKEINKQCKFKRYNFYDFPISSIIKTKNETMFNQRLDLFKGYMDANNFERDKSYEYYIDFNGENYIQLLFWTNLSLTTFKKYFKIFKNEILSIKFNSFFIEKNSNLLFKNANIEILLFLKEKFTKNKNHELDPTNQHYAFNDFKQFKIYCELFLLGRKQECTQREFQMFLKLFNGLIISKFMVWLEKIEKRRKDSLKVNYFFSSPLFIDFKNSTINVGSVDFNLNVIINTKVSSLTSVELVIDYFIDLLVNRTNKEIMITLPTINKSILEEINKKPTLFKMLLDKILETSDLVLMKSLLKLFSTDEPTTTTTTTTKTTTITITKKNEKSNNNKLMVEIYGMKILESMIYKLFSNVDVFKLFSVNNMFELFLIIFQTNCLVKYESKFDGSHSPLIINCPKITSFLIENFKNIYNHENHITKTCRLHFTDSTLTKDNESFFLKTKAILILDEFKPSLTNEILIKFFRNGWTIRVDAMFKDLFGGDVMMIKTYIENSGTIITSSLIIYSFKKSFYNVTDYLLTKSLPMLEIFEKITILNFLKYQDDISIFEQSTIFIKKILNSFTVSKFFNFTQSDNPEIKKTLIFSLSQALPFNPIQRKVFLSTLLENCNDDHIFYINQPEMIEFHKEIIIDEFNSQLFISEDNVAYRENKKSEYLYKYIKSRCQYLDLQFQGVLKTDLQQLIDAQQLDNIKLFSNFDLLVILEIAQREHYFSIIESIIKILELRIFSRGKNNKFELKKRIIYNCFKLKSYRIPYNKAITISKKVNNIKSLLFLIEIGFLKSQMITINNYKNNNRISNNKTIHEKRSKRIINDTFSFDLFYIIYKSIHTLNWNLLNVIALNNRTPYIHPKLFIDQNDDDYLINVEKIINKEELKFGTKTRELLKPFVKSLNRRSNY